MKLKFSSNARDLRARVQQVRASLRGAGAQAITSKVVNESLGMLVLGLNATVYETASGKYVRTEDLLRGGHVIPLRVAGQIGVEVFNTEPYAGFVEFGVLPAVSPRDGQARAARLQDSPQPLVTGRSGPEWQKPSLAHTRAAVYALYRIKAEVRANILKAWSGSAPGGVLGAAAGS